MGRYGGSNCGKCGGNHRGVCPAYYDEGEHLQDQLTAEVVAAATVFDKEQCSKCGTYDDVHECWHCDVVLCIECDPGEMRSDLDGHTYCDKHGPDSTMTVKEPKTIHPEDAPTCEECGGQIEHSTLLFTFPPENGLCECPNVIEYE